MRVDYYFDLLSHRRKSDEQIYVVGLDFCLICRAITANGAAFAAFMDDYVTFFCIGFS